MQALKVIAAVFLLLVVWNYLAATEATVETGEGAAVETYAEADAGVDVEPEPDPAYETTWEWVQKPTCDSGDVCWQIDVHSETGCPNGLYAEMNIMNADGVVIDYSNDTLGHLSPGGTARLTFHHYGEDAETGEIAEVSCR